MGVYGAQIGIQFSTASGGTYFMVGPGNPTQFAINLTQGVNRMHYDSTFAKEAWVQNIGLSSVPVTLFELYDIAPSTT